MIPNESQIEYANLYVGGIKSVCVCVSVWILLNGHEFQDIWSNLAYPLT